MVDNVASYLDDWEFHQATGMLSVQIGTHDMLEAALELIALAHRRHEPPHVTALLVIGRELSLPRFPARAAGTSVPREE